MKLKKALSLFLALVMALGCMSLPAFAATEDENLWFKYVIEPDGAATLDPDFGGFIKCIQASDDNVNRGRLPANKRINFLNSIGITVNDGYSPVDGHESQKTTSKVKVINHVDGTSKFVTVTSKMSVSSGTSGYQNYRVQVDVDGDGVANEDVIYLYLCFDKEAPEEEPAATHMVNVAAYPSGASNSVYIYDGSTHTSLDLAEGNLPIGGNATPRLYASEAGTYGTSYSLDGWYLAGDDGKPIGDEITGSFPITAETPDEVTLLAVYSVKTYTVNLTAGEHGSLQDGSGNPIANASCETEAGPTYYLRYNTVAAAATAVPDDGYVFDGWYYIGKKELSTSKTSWNAPGNVTLTAKFVKEHTVTFADRGSTVATKKVLDGSTVTAPAAPTRDGYTFDGWFAANSETAFDFDTPITSNITLTAHWTEDTPAQPDEPEQPADPGEEGPFLADGVKFRLAGQLDLFGADMTVADNFAATVKVFRGRDGLYDAGDKSLKFGMNGATSLGLAEDETRINELPVGNVGAEALGVSEDNQTTYNALFNAFDGVLARIGGDTLTINAGGKSAQYNFTRTADYKNDQITLTATPSGDFAGVWDSLFNSNTIRSTVETENSEFFVAGGSSFQIGNEMRTIPHNVHAPLISGEELDFQKFREPFYGDNITAITTVTENTDKVILVLKAGTALQLGESRVELLRDFTFTVDGLVLVPGMVTTLAGNTGDNTISLINTWASIFNGTSVTINAEVSDESAADFVGENKLRVAGSLDLFGADLQVGDDYTGSLTIYKGYDGLGGVSPTIRIVANGLGSSTGVVDKTISVGNIGIDALKTAVANVTSINPDDITYDWLYNGIIDPLTSNIAKQTVVLHYNDYSKTINFSQSTIKDGEDKTVGKTITFTGSGAGFDNTLEDLVGSEAGATILTSYNENAAEQIKFTLVEGSYIRVGNETRTLTTSLNDVSLLDANGEVDLEPFKAAMMGDIEKTVVTGENDGKVVIELLGGTTFTVGRTTVTITKPMRLTVAGLNVADGLISTISSMIEGTTNFGLDDIANLTTIIPTSAGTVDITLEVIEPEVAQIGEDKYESLEDAIAAAESGNTIRLISDLDLSEHVYREYYNLDLSGLTLDLDGHTITSNNAGVAWTGENAVIKNGSFVSLVPSTGAVGGAYAIFVGNDDYTTNGFLLKDLTMTGGVNVYNASGVVLEDLTVKGTTYYAVWADEAAEVIVKSGTYASTSTEAHAVLAAVKDDDTSSIRIEGGTYTVGDGQLLVLNGNRDVSITGGKFSSMPDSDYIATGYAAVDNTDDDKTTYLYKVVEKYTEQSTTDTSSSATTTSIVTDDTTITTSTGFAVDNTAVTPTYAIKTEVTTTVGEAAPTTTTTYTEVAVVTETAATVAEDVTSIESAAKEAVVATVNAYSATSESATFTAALAANDEATTAKVLQTTAAANAIAKAAAELTSEQTATVSKAKVILKTELKSFEASATDSSQAKKVTYDITPVAQLYKEGTSGLEAIGKPVALNNEDIKEGETFTFTIPVPSNMTASKVKVSHIGTNGYATEIGTYTPSETAGQVRYVTVTVDHFSEFELEEATVAELGTAKVTANLSLQDEIKINFKVSNLSKDKSFYSVEYKFGNGDWVLKSLNQADDSTGGVYKFVVASCAAKQMTDTVKFKLRCDGTEIFSYDYSIRQYCVNKINANSDAKLVALCRAILDYGAEAQTYFNYKANALELANAGGYGNGGSLPTIDSNYNNLSLGLSSYHYGITNVTANLTLVSNTELNFKLTADDVSKITGVTVTSSGSEAVNKEETVSGNVMTIKVNGIAAKYLDHVYTLSFNYDGVANSIQYSPLTYAYRNQNKTSDNLGSLCKALYQYWYTAKAYLN